MNETTAPPSNPTFCDLLKLTHKDALSVEAVSISAPADLDAAFAEMSRQPPGALLY